MASIGMELERQLGVIPNMLISGQRTLSRPSENEKLVASELRPAEPLQELTGTPPAQADYPLGRRCNMAQPRLRELDGSIRVRQRPPVMAGADIDVRYLPIMGVSGDYCDLLPFYKGQIGLAVGDACGKGVKAALLMKSVGITLRAHAKADPSASAGEILTRLNRVVCRGTQEDQFVTLAYGIWDADACIFTYSNAGHPPVLHYQAGTGSVSTLSVGGMLLGVCEEAEYPIESVSLETGDALVLYTDGIIEASDALGEVFGVDRLSEVVAAYGKESPEVLAAAILDAASRFAHQGWEDDVTLMVMKRAAV